LQRSIFVVIPGPSANRADGPGMTTIFTGRRR